MTLIHPMKRSNECARGSGGGYSNDQRVDIRQVFLPGLIGLVVDGQQLPGLKLQRRRIAQIAAVGVVPEHDLVLHVPGPAAVVAETGALSIGEDGGGRSWPADRRCGAVSGAEDSPTSAWGA